MWYWVQDVVRDAIGIRHTPGRLRQQEFWAVRDVSFELRRGECVGIIGSNGAGKSTLLKMLNGIIKPDSGTITIQGRTGALIEVGAGFHPQLTGRENVYVNAAILGMSKRETDAKFDQIVEFAGVKEFMDTPVKCYSSGMYVRLGFAIAVHTRPQILLVDEVLAVGDAEFQARCLRRIRELREERVSIIFVSHNLVTMQRVCNRMLLMKQGCVLSSGSPATVISHYYQSLPSLNGQSERSPNPHIDSSVRIVSGHLLDKNGTERNHFLSGESLIARMRYKAHRRIQRPQFVISFKSLDNDAYTGASTLYDRVEVEFIDGEGHAEVEFPNLALGAGVYDVNFAIFDSEMIGVHDWKWSLIRLMVTEDEPMVGRFQIPHMWRTGSC